MTDQLNGELLTFPCEFMIKVFGHTSPDFLPAVRTIVKKHISDLTEEAFIQRPSKDNHYVALTFTVHAESKEQLDNLYRDLTASPLVLMAL
ncbi:MAG: hypothetical protein A3E85_02575 [Gammaproteobacteria bacterium RIFCSPHIGHO2_12_FULL_45_12]|nr:MAG: hypothetical protein A3E85_02575 [Gammaproteobacteria bacterium RIFCSPHIGHO2_12_FULL_45_12]